MSTNNNLTDVLAFTAEKAIEISSANSVIGEKIEIDGMTVIPVSKLSVGFAGGGANISNNVKKTSNIPAGAGAKVKVEPVTFLVIDADGAHLINVNGGQGEPVTKLIEQAVEKIKQLRKSK